MITSNVSNTKNKLSELLQRVQQGEVVTILDRNKPVARLVPISPREEESHTASLIAAGVVQPPVDPTRYVPQPIMDGGDYSLLDTLLAMREEERA